jgi:hypothetical protein
LFGNLILHAHGKSGSTTALARSRTRRLSSGLLGASAGQPGRQPPVASQVPSVAAHRAAAYDQFKNYTGYTTRLNEANNAFNSAYAAKGTLQSGAALQALSKMNQDYASNEFGNYMGYLGGQQQLGPGAANALAGVGTNYANAAGSLAMQNGNNIANAAIARPTTATSFTAALRQGIGGMAGFDLRRLQLFRSNG